MNAGDELSDLSPETQTRRILQPEYPIHLRRFAAIRDAAVAVLARLAGMPDQHANTVHGA